MWQSLRSLLQQPLDLSHNSQHQIVAFILLTINWFALYFLVNITFNPKSMSKKNLIDTKNRIISIIHGLTAFCLGFYDVLTYGVYNQPNTQIQALACLISLSYCLYDLVACIYYQIADSGLIIHHLLCVAAFGSAVVDGYGGTDSMGGLVAAQISNLPMHIRCLLRNFSLRYTKMYEGFENAYLILYILARGIYTPIYVLYPCLNAPLSPIIVKLMCAAITVQSYHYIFKMITIIKRKQKQYKEMKDKKISYNWISEHQSLKELSFYKGSEGPHIF